MRPQKAHNIIDLAFKKGGFYDYSKDTLDGLEQLKHFKTPQAKNALKTLLEKAIKFESQYNHFKGSVSYYPVDNVGKIIANMNYISGRYNCVGRLQFLKEVLEKY